MRCRWCKNYFTPHDPRQIYCGPRCRQRFHAQRRRYRSLLQRPEWRTFRETLLQNSDYYCEHCGVTTHRLDVHHTKYLRGKKPWEYPRSLLRLLCRECHDLEHP